MSSIIFFILVILSYLDSYNADSIQLRYEIREEETTPKTIGNLISDSILQTKWNSTVKNSVSFNLLTTELLPKEMFQISTTGDLVLNKRLDRDSFCPLQVDCKNELKITSVPQAYLELIVVNLIILDVNDLTPTFSTQHVFLNISESSPRGTSFLLPIAVDLDSPSNSIRSYSLQGDAAILQLQPYSVTDRELTVNLQNSVDREEKDMYKFTLTAVDGGSPANSGSLTITVNVLDENDNIPVINKCESVDKAEDVPLNSILATVVATDKDIGLNGLLTYTIKNIQATCVKCTNIDKPSQAVMDEIKRTFNLNPKSGELRNVQPLDYEKYSSVSLTIEVSDSGSPRQSSQCVLTINVTDTNDNAPKIDISDLSGSGKYVVMENEPPGTKFGYVFIEDKDAGEAGRVSCVTSSTEFALQPSSSHTYLLVTKRSFDRENKSSYLLAIKCSDHGFPSQTSSEDVNISIGDKNDWEPQFRWPVNTVTLEEGQPAGQFIHDLRASDRDEGENARINYEVQKEFQPYFRILDNGSLVSNKVLDREELENYTFTVVAYDNGSPRKSSSTQMIVILTDINDCRPSFEDSDKVFYVLENAPDNTLVGQVVAKDQDKGMSGEVFYTAIDSNNNKVATAFYVDKLGNIFVRGHLDREVQEKYFLHVLAQDRGTPPLNGTGIITIVIQDVNDHSPRIRWPTLVNHSISVSYLTTPRVTIANIDAFDEDAGENAKLSFHLMESLGVSLFDVNSATGAIFVRRTIHANEIGKYELVVRVSDNGTPRLDSNATLLIIVDSSQVPTSSGLSASELNFLLIIVICSVTFVLSCILVASIWHTRRRLTPSPGRYYSSAKCCTGSDELDSIDAKIPMEPKRSQDMPLESLDTTLKISQASLSSRGDFMLPVRYCQIHDFDSTLNHRGSTLLPQYGLHNLRGHCDSGQSSESDSGRGTCFVEDDPFRRYGTPSSISDMNSHAPVRPWGVSTFTLDRSRPEKPPNNSASERTNIDNVDLLTVRRNNHKPSVDGVLV